MEHHYSGDRLSKRLEGPHTYQDQRRHTLHGTDWALGLDLDRTNYLSMGHRASTEETNSDEDSDNEVNSEDTCKLSTPSGKPHLTTKDKSDVWSQKPYLSPGDTFGRRASMSQLSLYGDIWGQAVPSEKYDLLPIPSKSTSIGPLDIPGDMGSFPQYQHPPLASRRNSRILPNPIQPPSLHGCRLSVDEQSEPPPPPPPPFTGSHSSLSSLSEHTILEEGPLCANGDTMLGGFVPGFDIWARNVSLHPQSSQQRRNSESVLHDLSAFADDHLVRSISSTTIPSTATTTTTTTSTTTSTTATATGSSPLDRRFSTSRLPTTGSSHVSDSPGNTHPPSLHPHFASNEGHGMRGSEMCGLCSIQQATMSMGTCGHRVCSVCHRHEKHRSMRLFQSVIPPCPFCAHGVTDTPGKMQKSLPVALPYPFNTHLLTQQTFHGAYGGQGGSGDDMSDGYPYHPTYSNPSALLRTGSGPLDMMSTRAGMFGGHYPTRMKPPTGPFIKPVSYAKGNQYAPTFPYNSPGTDMTRVGSMDMSMGRPGIGPPGWKDGSQGFVNDFYRNKLHQIYAPSHLPATFAMLPNLPPAIPPTVPRTEVIQWAVVRVINIPWDVSLQDMTTFFAGIPTPPEHLLSQNVHILMDRTTGKTFNSAFVELALTPVDAGMVAQAKNLKVLKGRVVTVELSSQEELLRSVFPKWVGHFENGEPVNPGDLTYEGQASDGSGTTSALVPPPFVTRDEINALLVVCRNYKLHFSRKCAERPFENILSILAKYPWHQPHRVLPLHRDHIFELLKLSIESLRMHLNKEYNTIHSTLLIRMVRCAILTPSFTERQKAMVLHVSGCACPEDIVGWMAPPVVANELASSSSETTIDGSEDGTLASTTDVSSKDLYKVEDDLEIEEQVESLEINQTKRGQETSSPVLHSSHLVSWASVAALTSKEPKVVKHMTLTSSEAKEVPLHQGTEILSPSPSQNVLLHRVPLSWSEVTSQAPSRTGVPRLSAGAMDFSFPALSSNEDHPKGQLPSPIEYRNQDAGPNLQPNTVMSSSGASLSATTAPFPCLAKESNQRGSLPKISVPRSLMAPGCSPTSSTTNIMNKSGSSILEAIKTITQSTPRLAKGSMGPKRQCREGGETL